jgi:preprotein translocase subunit YajC
VTGFLLVVVLLAAAWFLFALPARRRRTQHASMQDSVEVGDEIITAGGLHAIVREADEDELRIEIADGVVARLDRRAVAAVAREVEVEEPAEAPDDGTPAEPG